MSADQQPTPEQINARHARAIRGREMAASLGYSATSPNRSLLSECAAPPKLPFAPFAPFARLIEELSSETNAPVDYVAFSLLTTAAALIGNSRRAVSDPMVSDWGAPIGLWVCLVGPPSSKKSPAISPFASILAKIEEADAAAFKSRQGEHDAKVETAKLALAKWKAEVAAAYEKGAEPPAKPADAIVPARALAPRTYTNVTTIEALIGMLANNENGMLLLRDELAGWLGDMTRYSNSSDRPYWLQMFDGETVQKDAVKNDGEPLIAHNALMSVLGGMQPDRLQEMLREAKDGLIARFLFIFPDRVPVRRSVGKADKKKLQAIFDRLRGLKGDPVAMCFDGDAADEFFEHRKDTYRRGGDASGHLADWIGKGDGLVARLAVILMLLDWAVHGFGAAPHTVNADAVKRARALWAEYLLPMAERSFGDAARSVVERNAIALLKEIRRRGDAMINARIMYSDWNIDGLREAKPMHQALAYLCDAGWVDPADTMTGGRPKGNWSVNPALWEPV